MVALFKTIDSHLGVYSEGSCLSCHQARWKPWASFMHNSNIRLYSVVRPVVPSEWQLAKFTRHFWVEARDNLKRQKQSNHVHVSKGTFEVNYSLMNPKCTNPIDLAIGCNFIFACTNSRIIHLVCAFISRVLEVRYLDFSKFSARIIHVN